MCMCTVQVQARLANKLYFSATCFSVLPIFFWPRKTQLFLEGSYKLQNRLTSNHCGAYIHACPTRFLAQKTSDILGKRWPNKHSFLLVYLCTNLQSFYSYLLGGKLRKLARQNSDLSEQKGARLALTYPRYKTFPHVLETSALFVCSLPTGRRWDICDIELPRSTPARCSRTRWRGARCERRLACAGFPRPL